MDASEIASEISATENNASVAAEAASRAENAAEAVTAAAAMQVAQVTIAAADQIQESVRNVEEIKEEEKWLREKVVMLESNQSMMLSEVANLKTLIAQLSEILAASKSPVLPVQQARESAEVEVPTAVVVEPPKEEGVGLPAAENQSRKKLRRYL